MIKKYQHKNKTYYLIQLSIKDHKGKRYQPKYRYDKRGQRITSERTARLLEFEYKNNFIAELEGRLKALTFSQWHEIFLKEIRLSYKRSTVMQYDGDLKKWLPSSFCEKLIQDFTKADIHKLIFEYLPKKGASANLQKKTRRTLARVFESALEEGFIARNPCKGITIKVPEAPKKVLNPKEVELFLGAAKRINHPFYYLWSVALLTECRNGEMYSLRWKDIDLDAGIININSSWTNKDGLHQTKSNKNRVVPISTDLNSLLLELNNLGPFQETLSGLNEKKDFVSDLVLPRSSEWKHGEQSRVTKRFCNDLGITDVKFHDLRATFITNLLAHGVALPKVMSIVGHSRTSTTDVYLRLAGVNVKGTTDSLGYSIPQTGSDNVISMLKK